MRQFVASILVSSVCLAAAAPGAGARDDGESAARDSEASAMKIRLIVEGRELLATLDDTEAARDFLSLLPLELTLSDYAATEKVATLPRAINVEHAPAGAAAEPGDLSYYAPWGNLAIFYEPFRHSSGLVRLGRIDGDIGPLRVRGSLATRIESVN